MYEACNPALSACSPRQPTQTRWRRVAPGGEGQRDTPPLTLINPSRIYDLLLKPSLVALWLSQLMVFVVYPRFARRHGRLRATDLALAVGASAVALYGLYESVQQCVT